MLSGDEFYDDDVTDRVLDPRVSYMRCDECGDLLDFDGRCQVHGLLDPEVSDAAR